MHAGALYSPIGPSFMLSSEHIRGALAVKDGGARGKGKLGKMISSAVLLLLLAIAIATVVCLNSCLLAPYNNMYSYLSNSLQGQSH